jgi:hypothetical protein
MRRRRRTEGGAVRGAILAGALAAAAQTGGPRAQPGGTFSGTPGDLRVQNAKVLEYKRQEELKGLSGLAAFHGFHLADRLEESGITFRHQFVDDAGRDYKAVHYDHGTGLAVADVDRDGRLDVYFVSQLGGSELWRNLGGGKFENLTTTAGLGLAGRVAVGASFADVDNDGDADLFVTTVRHGNVLFENNGKGIFKDVARASGLGYEGHSSGAAFFDYNRDGLLDLFLANVGRYTTEMQGRGGYWIGFPDAFSGHLKPERAEASILYRNSGGRAFVSAGRETRLEHSAFSGDALAIDGNDDGFPDLYVLNMQGNDEYYENVEGKRFESKGRTRFPRTPWGSMGIVSLDYDQDGRMDLFLTDMHSDMSENIEPDRERLKAAIKWPPDFLRTGDQSIFGNALFHKAAAGTYDERSDAMGVETYWPWGVSAGDVNADGWDDLFITGGMNYPFRYSTNSLLLNDRGKRFVETAFTLGIEPRRGGRTLQPWFDLDCDVADKLRPDCQGKTGRVTVEGSLGSRSSAFLDVDDDGDLDLVTNEFGGPPMVLISDLAEQRAVHFLKVRLIGTASNRDGLGARVTVRAGSRSLTRVHDGKSGYLSQSSMPLYFGLDDATRVDAVEVRWPSGKSQTISEGISMNRLLEITEK